MSAAVLGMLTICVVCYTAQSFFNKMFSINYEGPAEAATPVFSLLYGLIVGVATLCVIGFRFQASPTTWAFGLVNGLVLFLYNLAMIKGARTGPYSFQTIMMLFGCILLPLFFSFVFLHTTISPLQGIGILVTLISFVVFNCKGMDLSVRKKGYFFWIGLVFCMNGAYGIILDSQQRMLAQTQRNEMIIITFLMSALISLIYLVITCHGQIRVSFRMPGRVWLFILLSSTAATIAVNYVMVLLAAAPAAVVYTVNNGGVLICSALLSFVALKEKMTRNMVLGLGIAVLGLVLLSL